VTSERFSRAGFVKSYVLPALYILLIPGVGIWFAGHATRSVDDEVRTGILASIANDAEASAEDKAQFTEFYRTTPASVICRGGTPQLDAMAASLEDVCSSHQQFAWIRLASWGSLAVGLLAFLFASACVGASLLSQRALFASFMAGWHVLKVAALLQTVAQGAITVALSYWMTVIWFERYVPKLILVVGLAALAALWLIVKAIFVRIDSVPALEGRLLSLEAAPRFWAHIRDMCRNLSTEPPRHIVAGVDDNFFVTENAVTVNGHQLEGRTLYVSFSLLKVLEKTEADAVLAHEMAHFSGDDTLYTRKMSPLLGRYGEYLTALYQGGLLTRPIFHYMLLFWALFQLSISRMSRQREFRADAIAAGATSPTDMGRALLKVIAYSSYRSRIEQELFSENVRQENIGIAGRVATGFTTYATSSSLLGDLGGMQFPHPFDSHPKLDARLAAIRAPMVPSHFARLLTAPVQASWLGDIEGAEEIERDMWQAYEQQFASAHEESLAWRYVPDTDAERDIVVKYFPGMRIATKKNDAWLEIDYTRVNFTEWDAPVEYGEIKECSIRESFGRKFLTIKLTSDRKKVEIPLNRLASADDAVATLERYHARHTSMTEYRAQNAV
jgi:Zn-dependent protease with chaperone function